MYTKQSTLWLFPLATAVAFHSPVSQHCGLAVNERCTKLSSSHRRKSWPVYAEPPSFPDRFGRWRFLQDLLDGDADENVANQVLYEVLRSYLAKPPTQSSDEDRIGSPDLTPELASKLEGTLAFSEENSLLILGEKSNMELIAGLESLLPDPQEEEDANKSVWDTVMEIHGRDLVQANEMDPTIEWRKLCLVARLLIHFDFLSAYMS